MTDNKAYLAGRKQYKRPQGMMWSLNAPNVTVKTETGLLIPDGIEVGADSNTTPSILILTDDNRSPFDFSIDRIGQRQRMVNGRMRSLHIADKLKLSTSWDMIPSRSFINDPNFNLSTGIPTFTSNNEKYTTDGGAGGNEMLEWYKANQDPFYVYLAYDRYPNVLKNATISAVSGNGSVATYTTSSNNKLSVGDLVVISGISTSAFNGTYTVLTATSTSFTVSNATVGEVSGSSGRVTSRSTLAQYNEVVEMYISSFSYNQTARGGSNFDFWNISVSLEEV